MHLVTEEGTTVHPLLTELEARQRAETLRALAEDHRRTSAVRRPRPRLRVRIGARLVAVGEALQGRPRLARPAH